MLYLDKLMKTETTDENIIGYVISAEELLKNCEEIYRPQMTDENTMEYIDVVEYLQDMEEDRCRFMVGAE